MGGRDVRWRRTAVTAMVAAGLVAATVPAHAGSQSPRQYYNGNIAYTSHVFQCTLTPFVEYMTGVYSGYYGTSDVTWPRVGDVYYVHIVMSTVGGICVGTDGYVEPELTLPPNTQLAISAANPVYCFAQDTQGHVSQISTANGCPTSPQYPSYSGHGTYSLYSTKAGVGPYSNNGWWALPTGAFLEFQVPVTSSQPMSGIATNSYVTGFTYDQSGEWAGASEGVFVAADDRIFIDGFESGNLANWSASSLTDGGNLSVQAGAAMRGTTRGLQAFVNDTNPLYVQDDHPTAQGRYRARFYFNPGTFDPGEASGAFRTRIFLAFANPSRRVMAVVLKRQAGAYSLMVRVRRDDGTQVDTGFIPISNATHSIEFDWKKSTGPGSNNGALRWWIDDVERTAISSVDNDTAVVDYARMGAMSIKAGASGILYFDELESRTTTPVGP